jgi:hypothetical protein
MATTRDTARESGFVLSTAEWQIVAVLLSPAIVVAVWSYRAFTGPGPRL